MHYYKLKLDHTLHDKACNIIYPINTVVSLVNIDFSSLI